MRLVRFGLKNYRSFRDSETLSFVAASLRDAPDHTIDSGAAARGLLPAVALFGGNASGKSNLLAALTEFRQHIATSFGRRPEQPIPWTPWRMTVDSGTPPTELCADVETEGVHHQYGFQFNRREYTSEWLYRWPHGQKQVLFERHAGEDTPYYFGPSLLGEKKRVADATRPNALYLSTAAQLNHPMLGAVFSGLVSGLRPARQVELRGFPLFGADSAVRNELHRGVIREFIEAADVGAVDYRFEKLDPSETFPHTLDELISGIPEDRRDAVSSALRHIDEIYTFVLERRTDDGDAWTLPPHLESAGTNVLLARLEDMLSLGESVLIVDELDTSLHPDLCALLVEQFTDPDCNRAGAQIVFSTHDRGLLAHLRRDEVVLVEKDRSGASSLHAASDFTGVRARDDKRRLHEQGRLGGVPVLGRPPALLREPL